MARLAMLKPLVRTLDARTAPLPPKTAAPIYSTPEYARWRNAVITRAGGRCQDASCRAQHYPGQRLFADHVKELRDGGAPFDITNGMARCGSSHTAKTMRERAKRMAR